MGIREDIEEGEVGIKRIKYGVEVYTGIYIG